MQIGLQVLRAKIRGFQAAGISLHNRIHKAKGSKRYKLWNEKRRLGCYAREHLIAYGLLRGVPYERIERCKEKNRPDAARVFELMRAHGNWSVARQLTINIVKELLAPGAPQPLPEREGLLARARGLLEKGAQERS